MLSGLGIGLPVPGPDFLGNLIVGLGGLLGIFTGGTGLGGLLAGLLGVPSF